MAFAALALLPWGTPGRLYASHLKTETFDEDTVALRIYGRGDYFHAYMEYGTSRWRAGGGALGGEAHIHTDTVDYPFSLNFNPNGGGGQGSITATVGHYTTTLSLDSGHRSDGAEFNQFGIMNVVKSVDDPGRLWLDDLTINEETSAFETDPGWDALNNRRSYTTTNVRPRFNFGYSPRTNHAGGAAAGELGGQTFRGDSRVEFGGSRLAFYGDELDDTLTLESPLHAEGRVALHRGVSDSTTLIGFFHSEGSVRSSDSQNSATPENFVGVAIEGPSSEGFYFYPTYGVDQEGVRADGGRGTQTPPPILPDGTSHLWSLDYDPSANAGAGSVTVTLDGQLVELDLDLGHKELGAQFNRFGIITTHIDGSGQTVYFDDLTYTTAVPEPGSAVLLGMGLLCGIQAIRRGHVLARQRI